MIKRNLIRGPIAGLRLIRKALVFIFWGLPLLIVWHLPRRGLRALWRWLCAQGRLLRASPLAFYRMLGRRRDWIVAKVEYVHTESAKWRACWTAVKLPYTGLRAMGLNPQMAIGLLALGGTAGGGVVVNETLLAERSFSRGDSGVYTAPSDAPTAYYEGDNTLKIDLGTTPVGEITIQNVTVGTAYANSALPQGETSVVQVGGVSGVNTYLEVGHLIIDRWRCTNFEISDTEVHTLNIKGNASDGQSISPSPGVPRRRAIGGGNRAEAMKTSGGYYDQIKIQAPTSGTNGKVDVMTLSNLYTKGGLCKLSRIKADTIDILLNEIGAGNGFATKEFVVATTTVYAIFNNNDNVEVSISPP
jgi:hypothetical protein